MLKVTNVLRSTLRFAAFHSFATKRTKFTADHSADEGPAPQKNAETSVLVMKIEQLLDAELNAERKSNSPQVTFFS